jgi:hypothetical protein
LKLKFKFQTKCKFSFFFSLWIESKQERKKKGRKELGSLRWRWNFPLGWSPTPLRSPCLLLLLTQTSSQ